MLEALEAAYPKTTLHVARAFDASPSRSGGLERPQGPREGLRAIYTAPTADAAAREFDAFAASGWGQRFPTMVKSRRAAWTQVIPFFAFPHDVRRVIYTTSILESVHPRIRKVM